jgi:hypothetical protein
MVLRNFWVPALSAFHNLVETRLRVRLCPRYAIFKAQAEPTAPFWSHALGKDSNAAREGGRGIV